MCRISYTHTHTHTHTHTPFYSACVRVHLHASRAQCVRHTVRRIVCAWVCACGRFISIAHDIVITGALLLLYSTTIVVYYYSTPYTTIVTPYSVYRPCTSLINNALQCTSRSTVHQQGRDMQLVPRGNILLK